MGRLKAIVFDGSRASVWSAISVDPADSFVRSSSNVIRVSPIWISPPFESGTGIFTMTPAEWFRGSDTGLDADTVERLIAQRNEHRNRREFAEADAIRQSLADQGIVLEDLPAGTVWRKA